MKIEIESLKMQNGEALNRIQNEKDAIELLKEDLTTCKKEMALLQ